MWRSTPAKVAGRVPPLGAAWAPAVDVPRRHQPRRNQAYPRMARSSLTRTPYLPCKGPNNPEARVPLPAAPSTKGRRLPRFTRGTPRPNWFQPRYPPADDLPLGGAPRRSASRKPTRASWIWRQGSRSQGLPRASVFASPSSPSAPLPSPSAASGQQRRNESEDRADRARTRAVRLRGRAFRGSRVGEQPVPGCLWASRSGGYTRCKMAC
jgi:hypothetical protein